MAVLVSGGMLLPSRDCAHDDLSDGARVLVFPETQNSPPQSFEMLRGLAVTLRIVVQLRPPPTGIRPGVRCVFRTAVPKASVDEHCDVWAGEGDVDASARPTGHWAVQAVAMSRSMQQTTHSHFGRCVSTCLAAHAVGDARRGRYCGHMAIVPANGVLGRRMSHERATAPPPTPGSKSPPPLPWVGPTGAASATGGGGVPAPLP